MACRASNIYFLDLCGGSLPFSIQMSNTVFWFDRHVPFLHCPFWWPLAICGCWALEMWLVQLRSWILFFSHTLGIWKFLDQGSNLSCSGDPHLKGSNTESLIHAPRQALIISNCCLSYSAFCSSRSFFPLLEQVLLLVFSSMTSPGMFPASCPDSHVSYRCPSAQTIIFQEEGTCPWSLLAASLIDTP